MKKFSGLVQAFEKKFIPKKDTGKPETQRFIKIY